MNTISRARSNIFFLILGLVLGGRIMAADPIAPGAAVATVNGTPVAFAELRRALIEERAGVFAYFKQKYNVNDTPDYWTTVHNGEQPFSVLCQRALAKLVRQKVQEQAMHDHGLWESFGYDAFSKALLAENERRKLARAHGEPIYGPVQYAEHAYYHYLFSNARLRFKQVLAGGEWKPSDAEIEQSYDKNKSQFYTRGLRAEVDVIAAAYKSNDACQKSLAWARIGEIQNFLKAGGELDSVVDSFAGNIKHELRAYFADEIRLSKFEMNPVAHAAHETPAGKTSGIIEGIGEYCIIRVRARDKNEYVSLSECREEVIIRHIDERYDTWVDECSANAKLILFPEWTRACAETIR